MNREELRAQSASRRSNPEEEKPVSKASWDCHYCSHSFKLELAFMKHRCRERDRIEELRGPIGQAAYSYYNAWFKARRLSTQPIETFAASRYYAVFIRFAKHVVTTNLPAPDEFIKLMVNLSPSINPTQWVADNIYSMYLQSFDAAVPPEKQFMQAIDELEGLAVDHHCKLPDVFQAVGVDALIELVEKRKLTHWALLASSRFKSYLLALPADQKERLAAAINVTAAVTRIEAEPYLAREFHNAMVELGL